MAVGSCSCRIQSLRKQRGRWYRGLRESLRYHRAMLMRSKYGRIGWFALPAFWLFEYLGPLIEVAGYGTLLFLVLVEHLLHRPLVNYDYLWAFLLASLGYGILVNIFAVLVGTWRFRYGLADRLQRRLLPFGQRSEVLLLLLYAVLENFGYRQLTLYWRLRGLWDAWRGKTGWEKFPRVGFRPGAVAARG
jgi:cellulose synthase/poly-beta-1,6-N-acetylglucosamine synthase-like glycosyltransferase